MKLASEKEADEIRRHVAAWYEKEAMPWFGSMATSAQMAVAEYVANQQGLTLHKGKVREGADEPIGIDSDEFFKMNLGDLFEPFRTEANKVFDGIMSRHHDHLKDGPALEDCPETGTLCSRCREKQYRTPSGDTCINGHGGEPPLEEEYEVVNEDSSRCCSDWPDCICFELNNV